jgi:excisionase family DNA binding protein
MSARKPWTGRLAEAAPAPRAVGAREVKPHQVAKTDLLPYCISVRDAAAYIGVGRSHMDYLVQTGQFPSARSGDRRLIRRIDLERYIDVQVERGYRFTPPASILECRSASEQMTTLANELSKHAAKSKDVEVADFLLLAARAYLQLATFYRWNGGLDEFSPEAIAERMSA